MTSSNVQRNECGVGTAQRCAAAANLVGESEKLQDKRSVCVRLSATRITPGGSALNQKLSRGQESRKRSGVSQVK